MEENVVFRKPQNSQTTGTSPQFLPVQPPSGTPKSSQSRAKKLIKLILGILIIGIIAGFFAFLIIRKQEEEPRDGKATLVYWGLEEPNVMQPIIDDFMEQNPTIEVTYAKQDTEQYRERIIARIDNDTGPDVFWFHNTWWAMLSSVLTPLPSEVITKNDFEKLYYKVAHNDLIKNGAIYGIPVGIDTLSLYTSSDLFDAAGLSPPTNWIDFANTARELTVKDENGNIKTAGAAVGTFENVTHAGDLISLFLVQNGSDLYNLSSTSQAASDALRFYTSFALVDKVWDASFEDSLLAFAKGKTAMYFGYARDYSKITAENPDMKLEIHPVPHLPNRDMTIASYFANGVSIRSRYQKEAMVFIKFLSRRETYQKLFNEMSKIKDFGEPYARRDLADLLKDNPVAYPFVSQMNGAVSSFFASDTKDNGLNDKTNEHLRNAVKEILSGTTTDVAVETLSQNVSQILQQYSSIRE